LTIALDPIILSTTSLAGFSIELSAKIAPFKPIAAVVYNATDASIRITAGGHVKWLPRFMGDIIPLGEGVYTLAVIPENLPTAPIPPKMFINIFLKGEAIPLALPVPAYIG
jgi:hypothetical protein